MAVALCLIDEDLKAGEKTMILRAFDDLMKWNFLLESTSKENILLKLALFWTQKLTTYLIY